MITPAVEVLPFANFSPTFEFGSFCIKAEKTAVDEVFPFTWYMAQDDGLLTEINALLSPLSLSPFLKVPVTNTHIDRADRGGPFTP